MKSVLKTIARVLKRERGFTLVEMVTLVAIMGVMAAVAVPMVSSQIGKARDKSYTQDLAMMPDRGRLLLHRRKQRPLSRPAQIPHHGRQQRC